MSIKNLGSFLVRNALVVLAFILVFGAGGYFYAKHKVTTTYTAHRSLIVSHTQLTGDAYAQTQADIALINTYSNVITDHAITDQVNAKMKHIKGYGYSKRTLPNQIKVVTEPNASWMKISVEANSKKMAQKITDTVALTAQRDLPQYISPAGQVMLLASAKDNSVTVNTTPNTKKLAVFAATAGLFVGLFVTFSWQLFRGSRRNGRHVK